MASDRLKGTTYLSPDGKVAVRMGSGVTAGQYFVLDPDNGGYYESDDEQITDIESSWKHLGVVTETEPVSTGS